MKKILFAFLVSALGVSLTHAQSNPTLNIISPLAAESFALGEEALVEFDTEGFEAELRTPITVTLIERFSRKRVRIGFVSQAPETGNYEVQWQIPEDLFEDKKIPGDRAYFKVFLSARVDGKVVRRYGKRSVITVDRSSTAPTGTLPTEVIVPDPVEEPANETVIDLSDKQLASRYSFQANAEPWEVRKLTVVNDTQGDGFDADPAEDTDAVSQIYVRYPNEAGELEVKQAPFQNGKATLSGLNFFIEKRSFAALEVFVDPIDLQQFSQNYSGLTYRVGLQDQGNNAASFEAVGQFSGATDNGLNSIQASSSSVEEFVIRKAGPTFNVLSNTQQNLFTGTNNVYEFSVASQGGLSLARMVFDVGQVGITSLEDVQFFRNGSLLTPGDANSTGSVYLMWDAGATSCFAHTDQNGPGTGMDCNGGTAGFGQLIVSFPQEERLGPGVTNTYKLRFNVGAMNDNANLSVRLASGDDQAKPSIGGAVSTTGKIHNGGLGNELFTGASEFTSEASTIQDRNIVWSDWSADVHQYPSFTPAANPTISTTSSEDWTNGYLLDVSILPLVISTR